MKKFFAYFLFVISFATMLIMIGDTTYKGIAAMYYSGYDQITVSENDTIYPLMTFTTFKERRRALCISRTTNVNNKEEVDHTDFVSHFTDEECKKIINDSSFLKPAYDDYVNENKNNERIGDIDDLVSSIIPLPFAIVFFLFSISLKKKLLGSDEVAKA